MWNKTSGGSDSPPDFTRGLSGRCVFNRVSTRVPLPGYVGSRISEVGLLDSGYHVISSMKSRNYVIKLYLLPLYHGVALSYFFLKFLNQKKNNFNSQNSSKKASELFREFCLADLILNPLRKGESIDDLNLLICAS